MFPIFSGFLKSKLISPNQWSSFAKPRMGLLIILLISIAIFFALRLYFFNPAQEAINPVLGPAVRAVSATGTVEATVMLPLAPPVTGRLKELLVDEGVLVKKGDILAKLEDEREGAALQAALANEDFAKKDYERNLGLFKDRAISIQTVEKSKRDLIAASAEVVKARAQQRDVTVIAPQQGVMIRRDGEIGELIPGNQTLFWLADTSNLRVTAEVDEEDVALLEPGQSVLMKADAFPQKSFTGRLLQITPKGDPISRSYRVRVSLPKPKDLLIGMTIEMNIIVEERASALLLPKESIRKETPHQPITATVWLWRDGKIKKQPVTLGIEGEWYQEVRAGIEPTDTILRDPPSNLQEGQKVSVQIVSLEPESKE